VATSPLGVNRKNGIARNGKRDPKQQNSLSIRGIDTGGIKGSVLSKPEFDESSQLHDSDLLTE